MEQQTAERLQRVDLSRATEATSEVRDVIADMFDYHP